MAVTGVNNITIYHNARCSKSRAALAYLEEHAPDATIDVVKYLDTPLPADKLKELFDLAGKTPYEALRKNEPEAKELGLTASTPDEDILAAMATHPKLVERPIVVTNKGARIARPTELIEEIL